MMTNCAFDVFSKKKENSGPCKGAGVNDVFSMQVDGDWSNTTSKEEMG